MTEEEPGHQLRLWLLAVGGLVNKPETALALAEIHIEARFGIDELRRQQPFTVTDERTAWLIEGSSNVDRQLEGEGAVYVQIAKTDGRVLDIGQPLIFDWSKQMDAP